MLSLDEFVALCKQYCPEWEHYEDWDDGEYWVSFTHLSDYAICMYQYTDNKIYIPQKLIYENGECVAANDDGIQPKTWEEHIIINVEDTDAKDRFIKCLIKLHQDYKQIQQDLKLTKIKEDF
jgi:hypothetical protein